MSDRPVSLAAVEDMLRKCGYHDIVPLLASVPTFAPATPDAATIARAAYVLGYKSGHADTVESRFTFDPGERWDEDEQLRADVGIATPTKPPREMPAPEWTGPDRWQYAYTRGGSEAYSHEPTDDVPEGYTAIGAWQPFAANSEALDWRRPLRRVQA